jgi:acyl-coenzyme A synthetase/AMP-(fatty) acid ligase
MYSPTFVTAVPDLLKIVAQLNFDQLRFVRGASAPLPDQLFQDLQKRFGVPVIEAFGMTEALSHCFTNPLHGEQRMGTIGLPDGIQADIVDGQLFIQGPSLFCTGWYNTGDLACQDSQGYFRILGRSRDQINVKGIKLNPVSLEKQIRAHMPEIKECVIFGSDTIKCLYTGDCEKNKIKNFLISLGSHCNPTLLENVDSIPLSPSEKISRSWLDKQWR